MPLKALNTVKSGGKYYAPGEMLPKLNKKDEAFLLENGAAIEVGDVEVDADFEFNVDGITQEDIEGLKQKELAQVARELDLKTPDKKAATLKEAIIEKLFGEEEVINIDEMDEAALRALADEEDIDLPDGADEAAIREILAEALTGEGE